MGSRPTSFGLPAYTGRAPVRPHGPPHVASLSSRAPGLSELPGDGQHPMPTEGRDSFLVCSTSRPRGVPAHSSLLARVHFLDIAFRERLTTTASAEEPVARPTSISIACVTWLWASSGILCLSILYSHAATVDAPGTVQLTKAFPASAIGICKFHAASRSDRRSKLFTSTLMCSTSCWSSEVLGTANIRFLAKLRKRETRSERKFLATSRAGTPDTASNPSQTTCIRFATGSDGRNFVRPK